MEIIDYYIDYKNDLLFVAFEELEEYQEYSLDDLKEWVREEFDLSDFTIRDEGTIEWDYVLEAYVLDNKENIQSFINQIK